MITQTQNTNIARATESINLLIIKSKVDIFLGTQLSILYLRHVMSTTDSSPSYLLIIVYTLYPVNKYQDWNMEIGHLSTEISLYCVLIMQNGGGMCYYKILLMSYKYVNDSYDDSQ